MSFANSPFTVSLPDGTSLQVNIGGPTVVVTCDQALSGSVAVTLADGVTPAALAQDTTSLRPIGTTDGYGQFECLDATGAVLATSDVFQLKNG